MIMELTLAPAESLVMQCLWESGADLTVYEITERLHEVYGKDYANNAVATFMAVLMKKGFVSRYKKHHSHQYHPEVTLDEFRNAQVNKMKNQWYHGSASGVLAALVETEADTAVTATAAKKAPAKAAPEDLQKMKELLDGYNS